MNVKSLFPTANKRADRAAEMKRLVEKWAPTKLLTGLNESEANQLARLLENQAGQILNEANSTSTEKGAEEWAGIALPLIRRIFSSISSKEFVSTQPMNLPNGLVFWLEHKYATGQAGYKTGSARDSQEDSVFGVTDARRGDAVGTGGLYGVGRFGYSVNDVDVVASVDSATSVQATKEFDLQYNSEVLALLDADITADRVLKVVVPVADLTTPDLEGVRAFTITDPLIKTQLSQYTRVSSDQTEITFIIVGESGTNATNMAAATPTVAYHKQPTDITRGDFEEGKTGEDPLDIPTLDLQMRQETIVAKTRKLKAIWTPEFSQDINAYHSIDAEAELTAMLGEYISQEIDFELLDMLITNAQTTNRWSAKIGFEYDAGTKQFSQTSANASAYNQGTWFQTLGTKLQSVSNQINKLTMRGGANFMVTSPEVATIIESIPGYAASTDGDKSQFAMGVRKVGALNNRFTVYKNPYMTENLILMGYRGSEYLETGAVYAPYIPLITTPLVLDPDNFTPRKGVMTRYAKKILRPEFYGTIQIDGLDTV